MGHVKNPHAIVSRALLSLSTSVVEGLPNAVLESIALETPILALRAISGVEELLNNNKYKQIKDNITFVLDLCYI